MELDSQQQNTVQQEESTLNPSVVPEGEQSIETSSEAFPVQQTPSADDFLDEDTQKEEVLIKKYKKLDKILTCVLVSVILVLLIMLGIKFFVVSGITVSGDSMQPNFESGEVVWVNKLVAPKRGDVIVFFTSRVDDRFMAEVYSLFNKKPVGKYEKLIKRVVALPGDKIWVEPSGDDFVLVVKPPDGTVLREDYYIVDDNKAQFFDYEGDGLVEVPYLGILGVLRDTTEDAPYVVKKDYFFAVGDNRFNSNDSRSFGSVPLSRRYGIVINK